MYIVINCDSVSLERALVEISTSDRVVCEFGHIFIFIAHHIITSLNSWAKQFEFYRDCKFGLNHCSHEQDNLSKDRNAL